MTQKEHSDDEVPVIDHTSIVFENGITGGQTALPKGREPTREDLTALCSSVLVDAIHLSEQKTKEEQTEFIKDVVNEYNRRKEFAETEQML